MSVLLSACDVHGVSEPGTLNTLIISPITQTLEIGETQQFTLTGTDAAGVAVSVSPVWSVAAGGGTISSNGVFTAGTTVGSFQNTVSATSGGVTAVASVNVVAGPLSTITITPDPDTLNASQTRQFVATGRDAGGNVIPVTVAWAVGSAGGGVISNTGLFTAGTVAGTYANTVTATSGGRVGTATVVVRTGALSSITVTPNPVTLAARGTQTFTAVGTDVNGNTVPITPTWSVAANGGVITDAGMFTAGDSIGTFTNTVRATSGSLVGTATVTVTAGAVTTLQISPNPATLRPGATQQFAVVGRDAGMNVVPISARWSVVGGGGTIDSLTGLYTAGASGGTFTNTVRATVNAIVGSATVIIVNPLASISVMPNPAVLTPGETQQFTAIGTGENGDTMSVTAVWSVVAGGGTINAATGLFTAGDSAGTFANTVRATSGLIAGSATVTVTPGAVTTLDVSPNPATLNAGATQLFTVVARDASSNIVPVNARWSVVGGGGTIDSLTGLYTAGATAGTFSNTVRATIDAIVGSATVIITNPLASITVTPNPAVMLPNGTQQFTAVAVASNGDTVSMTPVWTVVAGGGTIDSTTGLFTAGANTGTFASTVKATIGATSGFATVQILASTPTLSTITISPNPATVPVNGSVTFTAVGRDANGNVVSFTPVWSVTNGGGTINAMTGQFTAGSNAGTFTNTVRVTSGTMNDQATVNVTQVQSTPLINLGLAAPNGIMAGTAVTCVSGGIVNADVSISPGNTITGFGPCVITGVQNLANAAAANAQLALTQAYNDLAALPCSPSNAISSNLGGTTKAAGVYCTASGIGVTGTLTLDGGGDSNATFVFQAGTSLTTAGNIVLINGARARNVYWLVGTSATIGSASAWQGNVIALTSITLVDNATLIGRALARNGAVTLGTNNVITLP